GSKRYKELARLRSGTERSNAAKKETYKMKRRTTRVISYAFIRLALISLLEHSRVWVSKLLDGLSGTVPLSLLI
ncbi:MAG: hypothetical protein ABH852_04925, partial [Methanobacteriota archaeon]